MRGVLKVRPHTKSARGGGGGGGGGAVHFRPMYEKWGGGQSASENTLSLITNGYTFD